MFPPFVCTLVLSSNQGAFILFIIKEYLNMQDTEMHEMLLSIIKHAQTAKPSQFRLLRNWFEYTQCRKQCRTFKLALKALRRGTRRLLKNYCKGVAEGNSDLNKLLAYQQMQAVIAFYERELVTIGSMTVEYEAYLSAGNFLDAFLGASRY
jgi:hypothetical protein